MSKKESRDKECNGTSVGLGICFGSAYASSRSEKSSESVDKDNSDEERSE